MGAGAVGHLRRPEFLRLLIHDKSYLNVDSAAYQGDFEFKSYLEMTLLMNKPESRPTCKPGGGLFPTVIDEQFGSAGRTKIPQTNRPTQLCPSPPSVVTRPTKPRHGLSSRNGSLKSYRRTHRIAVGPPDTLIVWSDPRSDALQVISTRQP
jgi:hypothetical protein